MPDHTRISQETLARAAETLQIAILWAFVIALVVVGTESLQVAIFWGLVVALLIVAIGTIKGIFG